MEKHNPLDAIQTLKKAVDAVAIYRKSQASMYKTLSSQEREVRRIYNECKQRLKASRKKEKQRARAMFGSVGEEKKDSEKKSFLTGAETTSSTEPVSEASVSTTKVPMAISTELSPAVEGIPEGRRGMATGQLPHSTKRVSFADGSVPGDPDCDDSDPNFFEEHKEALYILTGIAMGCLAMHLVFNRRPR
jgi:hypothetical protein